MGSLCFVENHKDVRRRSLDSVHPSISFHEPSRALFIDAFSIGHEVDTTHSTGLWTGCCFLGQKLSADNVLKLCAHVQSTSHFIGGLCTIPFPHTIKRSAYEYQRNCSISSSVFCLRASVLLMFGKHLRHNVPQRMRAQLKTRLVDFETRKRKRCCERGRCIVSRVTLWILREFALAFTAKTTRGSEAIIL